MHAELGTALKERTQACRDASDEIEQIGCSKNYTLGIELAAAGMIVHFNLQDVFAQVM